ncbi:MAG TPA: glycosyltransferase [Candidatus Binataceae bacterium]|nr:glycosyltransferase [Candidatus Binataceae bacterium]
MNFEGERRVAIVVLGDLGRSPRMQYHALALAETGTGVDLIGYAGDPPIRAVRDHRRIRLHPLAPPRLLARRHLPHVVWVAASLILRCRQAVQLLWLLLFRIASLDIILVQNPPAIPTLLIGVLAARARSAQLVIDWHNFGYSMLALKLGAHHPAVRLARWYERILGRRAARHMCVSQAMRAELAAHWGISGATVLYDRPAAQFAPTPPSARDALLRRLGSSFGLPLDGARRPALIVSPTSWTDDEDYSMLLEAAAQCDQLIARHDRTAGKRAFADLVIVISGQGPLRDQYERKIRGLALARVHLRTLWLEPEDYPLLLGAADLGLCCHRSSCGLDLPMKIADLFGAGVPVLALDYGPCLREQIREGENGLLFRDATELAGLLYELFEGFPGPAPVLDRLRANLVRLPAMSWEEGWKAEAAAVFAPNQARG